MIKRKKQEQKERAHSINAETESDKVSILADAQQSTVPMEDDDVRDEREKVEQMSPSDALVVIRKLTKKFGSLAAVNDVSLSMNENEVFACLGPNGAGKTTMISMLVGLFSPSSGTALLNGHDIRTEMDLIRLGTLGFCPQHEILWPELTVIEHLLFYARLKGVPKSEEKQHVVW